MKKFVRKNKYILIGLFALLVYISFILINQELKYRELKADRELYTVQIEELKQTIDELTEMIDVISTPEYIEKMARERLQMVKPDELIYIMDKQKD